MPLVAGVDNSTQSTTIEIRDADNGALLGRGSYPHQPTTPPRSEQDPSHWAEAFSGAWVKATSQLSGSAFAPSDIAAISVAGQQHGMVALDSNRVVLRPAKLWNDTESADDAAWLTQQLSAESWAQTTGSVPVAAFTISKLSWMRRTEPELWKSVAHICLPHDWLNMYLCGELTTDRGEASGTGYWSPATGDYDYGILSLVDPERDFSGMLPRVAHPTEPIGQWQHVVVGPGTGDNMAAALGVGLAEGQTVVSLGTSGTVFRRSTAPTHDATGEVAGFADATGEFLPLVCTLNATKVTDRAAALLGVNLRGLDALAGAAPHDAQGLTMLPYLDGERTPNRPNATGQLSGLRSDTTPESFAKAAFNGVICGLLDAVDSLDQHCADNPSHSLLLVGGGSRSRAYQQTLANLSGRAVDIVGGDGAVARGAAIQATAVLTNTSLAEVTDAWRSPSPVSVEPDPTVDRIEILERYVELRDRSC